MGNGEDLTKALLGGSTPMSAQQMIESLQKQGYRIHKQDPLQEQGILEIKTNSIERWEGGYRLKFGIVSDTQFGSRHQQITFLNQVYDKFVLEGIDTVLHCGDLVDGDGRVYPGQEFDLFIHGYDAQLDYAERMYPRRDGVSTKLIAGNHDWSFWQHKGADILKALSARRPDIEYLGSKSAQITLGGLRIQLMHPHVRGHSVTYARSYRLQKIIEQITPSQKPDMLFLGDKHSWAPLPMYRNVYGWQVGCFQSQTNFEKELGLYPEIGGLIVEVTYNTKGADVRDQTMPGHEGRVSVVSIKDEILPLYVPLTNDF
jgi:predicted phosphodiesterase